MLDRLLAYGFRHGIRGAQRAAVLARGRTGTPSVETTTSDGLRFLADPTSMIDIEVLAGGSYEPHITAKLIEHLPPDGVLWDVGANTGVHSITVKHRRPDVTVVAIEANPLTFGRLYSNISANGLEVDARCVALGAERGYLPLSIVRHGNTGLSSLEPWEGVAYDGAVTVWCDTGDGLIAAGAPSPNVVKIDVEGYEEQVLAGMTAALTCVTAVVVEARPEVAASLSEAGFRLTTLDANANYLAVR